MKKQLHIKKIIWVCALLLFMLVIGQVAITQLKKAGFFQQKEQVLTEEEKPLTIHDIAEGKPTGDDPLKEMEKILNAYSRQKVFSFSGTVKLYQEMGEEDKVTEEKNIRFQKEGSRMYYSLGSIEYITQSKHTLMVDHDSKVINVTAGEPIKAGIMESMQIEQLKKYLQANSAEAIVTETETEKIITMMNNTDPLVQQYIIRYKKDRYWITGINMIMFRTEEMEEEDYTATEQMRLQREEERSKNPADSTYLPEELGYKQSFYEVEFVYTDFMEEVVWLPTQSVENYVLLNGDAFELKELYKEYELNY
jgi:hypothetical protein